MRFFAKNGIGIYFLICIMFKISFIIPKDIINGFYYFIMTIGLLLFFGYLKTLISRKVISIFSIFISFILLSLLYFLILDHRFESLLYLFAKFSTYVLIILGFLLNYQFYKFWITKYFKFIMFSLVVIGYFASSDQINYGERLSIGFNPNDIGEFGLFGLLSIIVLDNKWYRKIINSILIIFFLILIMLSGSKGALFSLIISVFLYYKVSFKLLLTSILALIFFQLSSNLGFTTLDRLKSDEKMFDNRELVFEKGIQTFQDNKWQGHGLDKYEWTDPKYWDSPELMLQPHNTYLGILIMYGLFFGLPLILMLLYLPFKTFKSATGSTDSFVVFSYIVIVVVLIKGVSESLVVGLNDPVTLLFWISVGVVLLNHFKNGKKIIL